ncbi:hypothetical protein D3C85_1695570 [compost metagenome]
MAPFSEAGIVDQQVHRPARGRDLGVQRRRRTGLRQIGGDDQHPDAVLCPQLRGQLSQRVIGTGGENEVAAALRQRLGKTAADAGRGAADQRGHARKRQGCHRKCS